MNRNQNATIQKWLLIFTGLVVFAFLFTFPTRDRRGTIDRIRLKVGAENLVSKKTMREVREEEIASGKRKRLTDAQILDKKAIARGQNSPAEQQARLSKNVTYYCNSKFDASSCSQWVNMCGDSCRSLVRPDLWAKMRLPDSSASRAIASNPNPVRKRR